MRSELTDLIVRDTRVSFLDQMVIGLAIEDKTVGRTRNLGRTGRDLDDITSAMQRLADQTMLINTDSERRCGQLLFGGLIVDVLANEAVAGNRLIQYDQDFLVQEISIIKC